MPAVDAAEDMREQNSVLACLERLRDLHSDLGLIDVCVLLLVAERPGVSLADIEFHLAIPKITASRALRAFAAEDFQSALPPALGLVDLRRSARDGRSLKAYLTDRGERLIRSLNADIDRAVRI
jgi:DNA-binding MarR family transcriptional regulator